MADKSKIQWCDATWPVVVGWWKPGPDKKARLIKGAALLLAEAERIGREIDYDCAISEDQPTREAKGEVTT